MNTVVTSRQEILDAARLLARQTPLCLISIRDVARNCEIAVGSVYNYFPSKAQLLAELTEEIWRVVFHGGHGGPVPAGFVDRVGWVFDRVSAGTAEYPAFFQAHPVHFRSGERKVGRAVMEHSFTHIKQGLLDALENDPQVDQSVFSEELTKKEVADFAFSCVLNVLSHEGENCQTLLKVLRQFVYKHT